MIFKKKTTEVSITNQTIKEEIANSITHGIGVLLSIIAFFVLLKSSISRGSTRHIVSCSLYGSSLLILYSVSTLYHSIPHIKVKKVLRVLDHMCIFLLIAGTYMPITLVLLQGALGWTLFGFECALCLLGIAFKLIFGTRFSFLSMLFYLLMSYVIVFAMKPIYEAASINGLMWIILGGVFYTCGIIFFAIDKKISYFHTIWHLFVLAGSFCHFIMVFFYIIPFP